MITFANPLGFWALLGIPAILLIHFLQRQSQLLTVSTLFLLDALDRESIQGRKFDRIRNSIPLWLQLLAVLLLTWILVQPGWIRENSVQKISIVLDSSASMRAFREQVVSALEKEIPLLSRGAQTVELVAMDSHIEGEPFYNGTSVEELVASLEDWKPFRPAHDPGPALRVGRSLAGVKGIVVYLTDHPVDTPGYDAKVLSIGEPIPNVGFAGVEVDSTVTPATWQVLVKNYDTAVQSREWFMQSGQQKTATRKLELAAGETRTLQGRFPRDSSSVILRLSPDDFDQDDTAPVTIPVPKKISIVKKANPKVDELMKNVIASIENTEKPGADGTVDLVLTTYNPLAPAKPDPVSIVFLSQNETGRHFFKGPIVSANHPLVGGLNWQGLIARSSPGMPVGPDDSVLLWQGDRALIFLRKDNENRQLLFNFDVPSSNLEKLPAFIVLTHRFVESIRNEKIAPFSENHELHQPIRLAHDRGEEAPNLELSAAGHVITIPLNQVKGLKAPAEPGFFEVRQGEILLLSGAAQFADTREADFSEAAPKSELASLKTVAVNEHTRKDDAWQIWLLLILLAVLLSWYFINRKLNASQLDLAAGTANS